MEGQLGELIRDQVDITAAESGIEKSRRRTLSAEINTLRGPASNGQGAFWLLQLQLSKAHGSLEFACLENVGRFCRGSGLKKGVNEMRIGRFGKISPQAPDSLFFHKRKE